MVTENQAKGLALGMAERATLNADKHWQLVVNELKKKIAELEAKLTEGEKG